MQKRLQKNDFLYVSLIAVTVLILLWIVVSMLPKDEAPVDPPPSDRPAPAVRVPVYEVPRADDILTAFFSDMVDPEITPQYKAVTEQLRARMTSENEADRLSLQELPIYPYEEVMYSMQADPVWILHMQYPVLAAVPFYCYNAPRFSDYYLCVYRTVDHAGTERYVFFILNGSLIARVMCCVTEPLKKMEDYTEVREGDSLTKLMETYPEIYVDLKRYNQVSFMRASVIMLASDGIVAWGYVDREGKSLRESEYLGSDDPDDFIIAKVYQKPYNRKGNDVIDEGIASKKLHCPDVHWYLFDCPYIPLPEPAAP